MGLTYLVCATERSGSTLLCASPPAPGVAGCPAEYFEALRETGLPRQPREYLSALPDPSRGGRLPAVEGDAAGRALRRTLRVAPRGGGGGGAARGPSRPPPLHAPPRREGTTGNGVFGAKM